MTPHIPLWCKSNFSFLEGASHPEELIERAHGLGIPAVAITDRDGVQGIVRAHVKARELGVKLLIGSQITVANPGTQTALRPQDVAGVGPREQGTSPLNLIATSREGYANLCRLISRGRLRNPKGYCRVSWGEVCEHSGGLIALWGGGRSLLEGDSDPHPVIGAVKDAFGDRLYALMARHKEAEDVHREARLGARAQGAGIPMVAATEVLYHNRARRDLQDVMTCLRHGKTLSTVGRLTRPNAEHDLHSPFTFNALYKDAPRAIARTQEIAERCDFNLDQIRYRYPSERLPGGKTSAEWLQKLTWDGARARYGGDVPPQIRTQLNKELALIDELDYCGYFLTMWEIVRFCKQEGILCQGRGSAANSAVCYCLGITAVDPTRVDLLFERFLSRERAEPPDIDLDIMHARREEAIQHVYQKYGRDHAAMVANVIRYRTRSAIREVGKVLGLSETAVDRLAKLSGHHGTLGEAVMAHTGLDPDSPVQGHLVRLVHEIQDFPRHLSIHPGGFLLGHEPVHDLVPIENGSMADRTVIQWDKDDLEDLGLFKVDLLGLGALTHLGHSFDLIRDHYGPVMTMADIPEGDPLTYDRICAGDTVGVFQIESRAQMAMLPRLRPRSYYDLVIEVSIVRPGPITGGMVHPYLRRRHGEEPVTYPHECLRPVLAKTLGVPLFQEQVMQLAMVAADYTPGEADQLRRDMAAWRRSGRIDRHRERLVTRMMQKGIEEAFAERVFEQIRGFGEYGFPESHAASFALIAYATSWLKAHYPDVFLCGLLNAWPMGFYRPATLVEDATRHGVTVLPADVSHSQWVCTLEATEEKQGDRHTGGGFSVAGGRFAVRMGLRFIKGLSEKRDWAAISGAREREPFTSVEDMQRRTRLDEDTFTRLAEAGALTSLCGNRRSALWQIQGFGQSRGDTLPLASQGESPAFANLNSFETIAWDYQASGHSARGHPLEPLRDQLAAMRLPDARSLSALPDGRRARFAGMVICRQRPGTASGVTFMTLEDETGFVNVVIWKKVFDKFMIMAKTLSFLGITGRIQSKDGVTHLIAERLWEPDLKLVPESPGSRDFK